MTSRHPSIQTAPLVQTDPSGKPYSLTAHLSPRRRMADFAATTVMVASFFAAAVPLVLIIGYVFTKGGRVVDMAFLTESIPNSYRRVGPGMGPAVVGTLLITGAASLMAIPLGVLGAVYLHEYGPKRRFARVVRFTTDVMTGVPSVVMGVFVYVVWVLRFRSQTGFAGALALACLMLPIVVRTTEEMLKLVPAELRQASTALGARTWRTTLTVVLPAALPGITSGAMLAVARAAGETAPIILVTGLTFQTNANLFEGNNTTLAAQIFRNASQPFDGAQARAYGAAFTLIVLVFIFTIVARLISSRFNRMRR
ncbi:MAG: phosphate ABC transporter permease PstA [Aquihabitans sp.]